MKNIIKTIYSKGVFRPMEKVNFPENTEVEISTLLDYPSTVSAKQLLGMFKYAKETYKKSKEKLPSGLEFQRKIRKESDCKLT